MRDADTIAAIATPPGRGGIGVIRVSGADLLPLAQTLTGSPARPRHATLSCFYDAEGTVLDRGLLLFFPKPHSFTGEDVLELHGHGGPVVMQMLLQRCLALGARLARPGEFSERAFLNDKLDLAQAEAVADLIDAATSSAARSAMRSLSGEFSLSIRTLVAELVELRMLVEATLDFPEEEIDVLRDTDAAIRLAQLRGDLASLQRRAQAGSLLRSGLTVVLAGLPNVGKSSLLNRLAGADRAIVTDVAGTTRDALHETIQIEGIPLHIVDTAGLREAEDKVERIGIERSWQEIKRADVILQLVDAQAGVGPDDMAIAEQLPNDVEKLLLHNKCDLLGLAPQRQEQDGAVHLFISAKEDQGIDLLQQELLRVAGWQGQGEDVILARERHLQALARAAEHLQRAEEALTQIEFCAEELRLCQTALGEITGEFSADDLLGEIFSRFCIGK